MAHNSGRAVEIEDEESLLPQDLQEKLDGLRDDLAKLDHGFRRVVQENPILTLFGALAGGYVIGRLIARR